MRGETCSTLERSGSSMVERAIDPVYLSEQYGTEERLRIRLEAHQRYSERADDYLDWILDRLQPRPGDLVVDVGCGVGSIHPPLCTRGVRAVLGVDVSKAMVSASQLQANQRGLPVIVIEADAQWLPLPDDAYDCASVRKPSTLENDELEAQRRSDSSRWFRDARKRIGACAQPPG
jgi:tRNA/tmRNA/rRNA uracil-C5-methylase (TrmA/RlmC/RlmD family)